MSDIIIIDSSDDEESKLNKKNLGLPVIVCVESFADLKRSNNTRKRVLIKNIGECTLSIIKKVKKNSELIEISDDSDDNRIEIKQEKISPIGTPEQSPKNFSNKLGQEPNHIDHGIISLVDDCSKKTENHKQDLGNGTRYKEMLDNRYNRLQINPIIKYNSEISFSTLPSTSSYKGPQDSGLDSSINNTISSNLSDNYIIKNSSSEVFEELLKVCESVDSTDDMKKVIAKLQKYYNSAHKHYRESKPFLKLIRRTKRLVKSQKNYYLHIKDCIEELRIRKDESIETIDTGDSSTRDTEDCSRRSADKEEYQILRLQSAMKKLNKILKDLEQREVDFDDEEDSTYILKDKYERRMVKIYDKLCSITGEKPCAGRAVKRKFSIVPGLHPSIDKRIQDLVNKQKTFPDFHDVLKVIKACNEEHNLKLSSTAAEYEARKVFQKVGTELQRRRCADYYLSISDYLDTESDPATQDLVLLSKLDSNHKENNHKISDIINKYVEKAEQLGLKGEEVKTDDENISDNENKSEAERGSSHDESSDEDSINETTPKNLVSSIESDKDLDDVNTNSKDETCHPIDIKQNNGTPFINKDTEELQNNKSLDANELDSNHFETNKDKNKL